MPTNNRSVLEFEQLLVLFLAGVLAHFLAGGSFIDAKRLIALLVIIFSSLVITKNIDLQGPQLALFIVVLQSVGHFILGGADMTGNSRMTFSHILTGLISYKTIGYFRHFWRLLEGLAKGLIPRPFSAVIIFSDIPQEPVSETKSPLVRLVYGFRMFRGPPPLRNFFYES